MTNETRTPSPDAPGSVAGAVPSPALPSERPLDAAADHGSGSRSRHGEGTTDGIDARGVDAILAAWEADTMDAAGTIEDLVDLIEAQSAELECLKHDFDRRAATANELLNEVEAQSATIAELREALEPFAACPTVGKEGGRFVIANATFDDMGQGSSAPRLGYWHMEDFDKARAALATKGR